MLLKLKIFKVGQLAGQTKRRRGLWEELWQPGPQPGSQVRSSDFSVRRAPIHRVSKVGLSVELLPSECFLSHGAAKTERGLHSRKTGISFDQIKSS